MARNGVRHFEKVGPAGMSSTQTVFRLSTMSAMCLVAFLTGAALCFAEETVVESLWIPILPEFPGADVLDAAFGPEQTLWVVGGRPIDTTTRIRTRIDGDQREYVYILDATSEENALYVWNRTYWYGVPTAPIFSSLPIVPSIVTSIAVADTTLWLGTDQGLVQATISGASDAFVVSPARILGVSDGMAGRYVAQLEYDAVRGILWAAHWESRVSTCKIGAHSRFVDEHGGATRLQKTLTEQGIDWVRTAFPASRDFDGSWFGLAGERTYDLDFLDGDRFWLATEEGLNAFDGTRWQSYGVRDNLPAQRATAVAIGDGTDVWAGTPVGAAWRDRGHWLTLNRITTEGGLNNDTITRVMLDHDRKVWFGTAGGVFSYDPLRLAWHAHIGNVTGTVRDLWLDLEDGLWAGFMDSGTAAISRFVPDTRVRLLTPGNQAIVNGPDVIFNWEGGPGAESYEVWITGVGGSRKRNVRRPPLTVTLPDSGEYRWTARAVYRNGKVGPTADENVFFVERAFADQRGFYLLGEPAELDALETRGSIERQPGIPLAVPGNAVLEYVDWDEDGAEDLLVAASDGRVRLFRKEGGTNPPRFAPPEILLDRGDNGVDVTLHTLDVADWDGDGRLDLLLGVNRQLLGGQRGAVRWFRNVGTRGAPRLAARHVSLNHPHPEQIDVFYWSAPAMGDLNGDGHPDLLVGNGDGEIVSFLNLAPRGMPQFDEIDRVRLFPPPGLDAVPLLVDWDQDGISDLLVGNDAGHVLFYRNAGTTHAPVYEDGRRVLAGGVPLAVGGTDVFGFVGDAVPVAWDWNHDGKLDLVVGDGLGDVYLFLNSGTPGAEPILSAGQLLRDRNNTPVGTLDFAAPAIADWDGDGLEDLLVGNGDGYVLFYRNVNNATQAALNEPPRLLPVGPLTASGAVLRPDYRAQPRVADYNRDGKRDLVLGADDGTLRVYLNGAPGSGMPVLTVPLRVSLLGADLNPGLDAKPEAVDWDGDGKRDLLVGTRTGRVRLYRNVSTTTRTVLAEAVAVDAPVPPPGTGRAEINVQNRAVPYVADWDNDGDGDLLVGAGDGTLVLFRNTGTGVATDLAAPVSVRVAGQLLNAGANAIPQIGFWNSDEVTDLLVGTSEGRILLYQQDRSARYATRYFAPFRAQDVSTPDAGSGRPQFSYPSTSGRPIDFAGASPAGFTEIERFSEGVMAAWLDGNVQVRFTVPGSVTLAPSSPLPWRIDLTSEVGGYIAGDPVATVDGRLRFFLDNDEALPTEVLTEARETCGYARLLDVAGLPYSASNGTARFALLAERAFPCQGREVLIYERTYLGLRPKAGNRVTVDADALAIAGFASASTGTIGRQSHAFAVLTPGQLVIYGDDELTQRRFSLDAPGGPRDQYQRAHGSVPLQALDLAVDADNILYVLFRVGTRPTDRGRVVYSFREAGRSHTWLPTTRPGIERTGSPRPVSQAAIAADMRPEDLPSRPIYVPTPRTLPPTYAVARPLISEATFRIAAEHGFSHDGVQGVTSALDGDAFIGDFLRMVVDSARGGYLRWQRDRQTGSTVLDASGELYLDFDNVVFAVSASVPRQPYRLLLLKGPFGIHLDTGAIEFLPQTQVTMAVPPLGLLVLDELYLLGMPDGPFREASRSGLVATGRSAQVAAGLGPLGFRTLFLAEFFGELFVTFGTGGLPGLPPSVIDDRVWFLDPRYPNGCFPVQVSGGTLFGPYGPGALSYSTALAEVQDGAGDRLYAMRLGNLWVTPGVVGSATFSDSSFTFENACGMNFPAFPLIGLPFHAEIADGSDGPGIYADSVTVTIAPGTGYSYDFHLDHLRAGRNQLSFDDEEEFQSIAQMGATLRGVRIPPPYDRSGALHVARAHLNTLDAAEGSDFEFFLHDLRFHFGRAATFGRGESTIWSDDLLRNETNSQEELMTLSLLDGGTVERDRILVGASRLSTPPSSNPYRPATMSTFPGGVIERFSVSLDPSPKLDLYGVVTQSARASYSRHGLFTPGAVRPGEKASTTFNGVTLPPGQAFYFASARMNQDGNIFNMPGVSISVEPSSGNWQPLNAFSDPVPFAADIATGKIEILKFGGLGQENNAIGYNLFATPKVDFFGVLELAPPLKVTFDYDVEKNLLTLETKMKLGPIEELTLTLTFRKTRTEEIRFEAVLANPGCRLVVPPAECQLPPGYPIYQETVTLLLINGGYNFGDPAVFVGVKLYGGKPLKGIPFTNRDWVYLVTAEAEARYSFRGYFQLSSNAKLLDMYKFAELLLVAGKVHLEGNYQGDGAYVSGRVQLFGFLRGTTTAWFYTSGNYGIVGEMEIGLPSWIPIIGGSSFNIRIALVNNVFKATLTVRVNLGLVTIKIRVGIRIDKSGIHFDRVPGPAQYVFHEGYHAKDGTSVLTNFRALPLAPWKEADPFMIRATGQSNGMHGTTGRGFSSVVDPLSPRNACQMDERGRRVAAADVSSGASTLIIRYDFTHTGIEDATLSVRLPSGEIRHATDIPRLEAYPNVVLATGDIPVFFTRKRVDSVNPDERLREVALVIKGPIGQQMITVPTVDPVTGRLLTEDGAAVSETGTGPVEPGRYTVWIETSDGDPCEGLVEFLLDNRPPVLESVAFSPVRDATPGLYHLAWNVSDADIDPVTVTVHASPDLSYPERSHILDATQAVLNETQEVALDLNVLSPRNITVPVHLFLSLDDGREPPSYTYVDTVEVPKPDKCPPQVRDVVFLLRGRTMLVCWDPIEWQPPDGVWHASYSVLVTDISPHAPFRDPIEVTVLPDRVEAVVRDLVPGRRYRVQVNAIAVEDGTGPGGQPNRIICGGQPSPPLIIDVPPDEAVNGPPYFVSLPLRSVTLRENFNYDVVVNDPEGETVALTVEQLDYPDAEPPEEPPVPEGSPTYTPQPQETPPPTVRPQQTLPIDLVPQPPTQDGQRYRLSVPLTQVPGDLEQFIGHYALRLVATDPHGATAEQIFSLVVDTGGPSTRGRIVSQPRQVAIVGHEYRYAVETLLQSPNAGARVRYRLLVGPPGLGIDPDTGLVRWTPAWTDIGTHPVAIAVHEAPPACTDCLGALLDQQEYILHVVPDPDEEFQRPVARAGPDQTVDEYTWVTLDGSASTIPLGAPEPMRYTWSVADNRPDVVLTSPNQARTQFFAPPVSAGIDTIAVQLIVSDGAGVQSEPDSVTIRVRDTDPTRTPTFTSTQTPTATPTATFTRSFTPTPTPTPYIERPRLALVRRGNICLAELDGSNVQWLTDYSDESPVQAGVSLANGRIAYVRQARVWWLTIYDTGGEIAAPGTTDVPIPGTEDVVSPHVALLPSGRRVAYLASREGTALVTVNLDGNAPVQVIHSPDVIDWPSWNVASYITYASAEAEMPAGSGIYRVNHDGLKPPVGVFSPDADRPTSGGPGAALAFVRHGTELWTIAPGGTAAEQVPGVVLGATSWPRWQPGTAVLFFVREGDVWRVNRNGSGQARVTALGDVVAFDIGFAPRASDSDFDGLADPLEGNPPVPGQSNTYLPDSDGDGLIDGLEDANRNGLRDAGETGSRINDSDSDRLEDGIEVGITFTDPLNPTRPGNYLDADQDGLPALDAAGAMLDPNDHNPDIDGDGYSDGYEAMVLGLSAVGLSSLRPDLGDVFADGQVTNLDALVIQTMLLRLIGYDAHSSNHGDANRDGFISNLDALVISSFFLGITERLPLGL